MNYTAEAGSIRRVLTQPLNRWAIVIRPLTRTITPSSRSGTVPFANSNHSSVTRAWLRLCRLRCGRGGLQKASGCFEFSSIECRGMSVAEITYQPSFSAELVSASRFLPPLQKKPDLVMFIDAPAFGGKVMSEITDIMIGDGYEEVTFESAVDAD